MQGDAIPLFAWRRRKKTPANFVVGAASDSTLQLYEGEVRAWYEAQAAEYFTAFESSKALRQETIRRSIDALGPGPIVVIPFNWGYRQLVHNWAVSCDRHAIDCRRFTLLFPTDARAASFARKLGFAAYFDGASYGELPEEAHERFGDSSFRKCLFAKIAATQDTLTAGRDLIRQDADIVWNRDPRPYLARKAHQEGLQYLFMNDGPNPFHGPLHYNSGFVFIRNSATARAAWDCVFSSYGRMLHCGSEQKVINAIMTELRTKDLRSARLSDELFVNGHLISDASNNGAALPNSPSVVHASWTANITKKFEHLKRFDLWYL